MRKKACPAHRDTLWKAISYGICQQAKQPHRKASLCGKTEKEQVRAWPPVTAEAPLSFHVSDLSPKGFTVTDSLRLADEIRPLTQFRVLPNAADEEKRYILIWWFYYIPPANSLSMRNTTEKAVYFHQILVYSAKKSQCLCTLQRLYMNIWFDL